MVPFKNVTMLLMIHECFKKIIQATNNVTKINFCIHDNLLKKYMENRYSKEHTCGSTKRVWCL